MLKSLVLVLDVVPAGAVRGAVVCWCSSVGGVDACCRFTDLITECVVGDSCLRKYEKLGTGKA